MVIATKYLLKCTTLLTEISQNISLFESLNHFKNMINLTRNNCVFAS